MKKLVIPFSEELVQKDGLTIIWLGTSEASRFVNGEWLRDPSYDYRFSVTQRRFSHHWESVKDMHRVHPAYDGRGGDRDQTMFFRIGFEQPVGTDRLAVAVESSLGTGNGLADVEFRKQTIEINLKQGVLERFFSPYNTIALDQEYRYEEGVLIETVTLSKKDPSGRKTFFMRNQERASFFMETKLGGAPTRFGL